MRTSKVTLYFVCVLYIATTLLLCVVVLQRQTEFSRDVRLFLNIGSFTILKTLVWGNVVSIILFLSMWIVEVSHILRLRRENRKLRAKVNKQAKELDAHLEQAPTLSNEAIEPPAEQT